MKGLIITLGRVVTIVAVCAGSVAVAILAFPLADYRADDEAQLSEQDVAVLRKHTRRTAVAEAELTWTEATTTKVGDASGKVTAVFVAAGEPLACGAAVIAVDGGNRLAMCGDVPPWRNITAKTTGPDADQLAELLVSLDLLAASDRDRGSRRMAAWRKLARSNGLKNSAIFHPSDVIWIGKPTTPTQVTVRAGDNVTGDSTIFEVDTTLRAASIQTAAGEPITSTEHVFSVENHTTEFTIRADGSIDTSTFEAAVRSKQTDTDTALPTQVRGTVRLAVPVSFAAVPPTAIISDTDGTTCVVLAAGGTAPVTIVEATTGLALVESDLAEGVMIRDFPQAGTSC